MTEYKPFERNKENKFSYWFPRIEKCGIAVPKSAIFQVPQDIVMHLHNEEFSEAYTALYNIVRDVIRPTLDELGIKPMLFIKNSTFSNKFNAKSSCMPDFQFDYNMVLAQAILNINLASMEMGFMGAGGYDEIIIRERIRHDPRKTPCIYNGLPLRPEFRVFYDFDTQKVLFSVNYWDADYLHGRMYDMTDQLVFDAMSPSLNEVFESKKDEIENLVAESMKSVTGLDGAWSIDIMLDNKEKPYLIDMAVAEQSAYWEWRNGKIIPEPEEEPDLSWMIETKIIEPIDSIE